MVELFRDDKRAAELRATVSAVFHDDFESFNVRPAGRGQVRRGLDELRAGWVDWLEPWDSYYMEIKDVIDFGDRVLVLARDHGRRKGLAGDVELRAATIWTVRDEKVARAEFYTNSDQVLGSVGLAEEPLSP